MGNFNKFFLLLAFFASNKILGAHNFSKADLDSVYRQLIDPNEKIRKDRTYYWRCLCCEKYIEMANVYSHYKAARGVGFNSSQEHAAKLQEIIDSGEHKPVMEYLYDQRQRRCEIFRRSLKKRKAAEADAVAGLVAMAGGGKVRKRAGGGTARAGAGSAV